MRRASKPQWVYLPNGDLSGIAMGSDFCAEHEWGVDRLKHLFGCDTTKEGVEKRQMTQIPKDLFLHEGKLPHPYDKRKKETPYEAMFLTPRESYYRQPDGWVDTQLRPYGEETLCCAWDEKTFGIAVFGDKDKKNLKLMWEAFQRKDVAFWPNIGVFHLGAGLIFCIVSKVPDQDKKNMVDGDRDHAELQKQSKATGIEEELKAAKKGFIALSPKWSKDIRSTKDGEIKTTYPVIYWLNPMEQDRNNFGWYTVEQLKQWIKNEGPIPMAEKARNARRNR